VGTSAASDCPIHDLAVAIPTFATALIAIAPFPTPLFVSA